MAIADQRKVPEETVPEEEKVTTVDGGQGCWI